MSLDLHAVTNEMLPLNVTFSLFSSPVLTYTNMWKVCCKSHLQTAVLVHFVTRYDNLNMQ